MADNTTLNSGAGGDPVVTREISHSGDTAKLPGSFLMGIAGSEGAYTVGAINGDATNGLDVDVTRVGGTVTVAGTVTADLSATDNAVLDAIAASLAGTLTVGSHAVTNAGTFAVQAAQSGTWNVTNISGTISLPTGAATAANQATLIGHVDGLEGLLTTIDADTGNIATAVATVAGAVAGTEMQVDVLTMPVVAVTGTFWQATQPVSGTVAVSGSVAVTGTFWQATQPVSAASLPLPTGASTEATLSTLNGKVTACDTGAVVLTTGTASIGKLAANAGVTIGAVEIAAAQTLATVTTVSTVTTCSTVTTLTGSGVAHDAADSGNPHKIGGIASTAISGRTMVANNDRTDAVFGIDGVQITRSHCNLEDVVQERATNTDGASTAFASGLAAPGAGIRLWITGVCLANSSATDITVDLRDGAAGSVLWTLSVPAAGGNNWQFNPPLRLSANTALAFDSSAAVTTLSVSANGFKSKV